MALENMPKRTTIAVIIGTIILVPASVFVIKNIQTRNAEAEARRKAEQEIQAQSEAIKRADRQIEEQEEAARQRALEQQRQQQEEAARQRAIEQQRQQQEEAARQRALEQQRQQQEEARKRAKKEAKERKKKLEREDKEEKRRNRREDEEDRKNYHSKQKEIRQQINKIADRIFYEKYRIRRSQIRPQQTVLIKRWLQIRNCEAIVEYIFHQKHPELKGRKIKSGEISLAKEWFDIKNSLESCH